jgi:hypothetical protein
MIKAKTWVSRILLAFVFVTIGFALGRQTAPQSPPPAQAAGGSSSRPAATEDKVVVYSVHMTFRCWECNQIEWLTKELLEKEFAEELTSGKIEYRSVDYMQDDEFARRYNIASSTVVVTRLQDGKEVEFERLDEVWTKSRNRDEFMAYVKGAIQSQLQQLRRGDA